MRSLEAELQLATQAASPAIPRLAVEHVSLVYRQDDRVVRATHDVSFEVQAGERYVLLGPSGCGKSTLLKAIAGFVTPDAGRIRLDGRTVSEPGPDRVVVFQEFDQLAPWKTVRGNVEFALRAVHRASKVEARQRADVVLEAVGLTAFADAWPHTLSGGMKQRVAIARALALEPRVLLMDEPFAALDALTRRRMQAELLALAERIGFTLVFVTHSIEEALVVGTRIGVLTPHPGRLRAEIDSRGFGHDDVGSAAFQAAAQRIHERLFGSAAGAAS